MDEKILETCKKSFATHKATLIQDTDRFLIIDWQKENGDGNYYVNYIVDKKKGNLIVSGDLGDSIATWFNPVEPTKLKNYVQNIGYYISKFQAYSDRYYFETENVISDMKEELAEIEIEDEVFIDGEFFSTEEFWEQIEDEVEKCIYGDEFIPSGRIDHILEEIGCYDTFEWLYTCGRRIDTRVYLWAVGFKMACEQLGI